MTKTCKGCQQPFDVAEAMFRLIAYCQPCTVKAMAALETQKQQAATAARMKRWRDLCPLEFHDTKRDKLPLPEMLDRVMTWQRGNKGAGLLLHGPTGLGKTRCAWVLLWREIMDGAGVAVISPKSGIDYAETFKRGTDVAAAWVRHRMRADILLLDDPFKANLSASYESCLYSVVNERAQHLLPCIFTVNDSGATLSARMSQDRAEPMVRRIRETTVALGFFKKVAK